MSPLYMYFMHSRSIHSHCLRYYFTIKLRVKHNDSPLTQLPIDHCITIKDGAQQVKQEFDTLYQPVLFSCRHGKAALGPIHQLHQTRHLNTGKCPLLQDSVQSKTIFIRGMDEGGSYTQVCVESDDDMRQHYEYRGSALYLITEPKNLITKFKQLKDGEKYDVYSRYTKSLFQLQELRRQRKENKDMEADTLLALKKYLQQHLGSTVISLPTIDLNANSNIVPEWDAAYKVDDVLYLCRAKHVMCIDKIPKIHQHISLFKEQFQLHTQKEFMMGIHKVVGVACADYIPPLVRKQAHELGLICVYVSGWGHNGYTRVPTGFTMER